MGCGSSSKLLDFNSITADEMANLKDTVKSLKKDEYKQMGLMIMTRVINDDPSVNAFWKSSLVSPSEWKRQIKDHGCKMIEFIDLCVTNCMDNEESFKNMVAKLSSSHLKSMILPTYEKHFLTAFIESLKRECGSSWNSARQNAWTKFFRVLWTQIGEVCTK